jgi:hypothetical protein
MNTLKHYLIVAAAAAIAAPAFAARHDIAGEPLYATTAPRASASCSSNWGRRA